MKTNARDEPRTNKEVATVSEWMTLKEMQKLLNIGATKAYELVSSGTIPGVIKIGRAIRINRRELDDWLKQQMVSAGNR